MTVSVLKPALVTMLDIVERIDDAHTIAEAAQALLRGMKPMGVLSVAASGVRNGPRVPAIKAGPPLIALTPRGWTGSEAANFMEEHNPNPEAARRLRRPFQWREASLPTKALNGAYWEALGEFGAVDGLAIPLFNPKQLLGVSMAMANGDLEPRERRAMEFACYAFIDKVRSLLPDPPEPPRLTARERDCMAFVAEGKTDWEISVILGVSQHTSHQYVESARKKLGAATRAQAVARFVMLGLL